MRPGTQQAFIDVAQRLSSHLPGGWDRRLRELGKIALNYRGSRHHALRHVQYQLVRQRTRLLVTPFGPGEIVIDATDDEVGRTVFLTGGYEREHMAAAVRHLGYAGHPPAGRVFVDVGANIGTSTLDALLQFGFGHAVCFEPDPHNARLLRMSALLNDLGDRVAIHQVAVSDEDGTAVLHRSLRNSGDHRIASAAANGSGEKQAVLCRRLDAFVEVGALDPDAVGLVWIDTQGHEPHVLRGAGSLLAAGVPVVVEYCPWVLLDGAAHLEELIARHFTRVVDLRRAASGDDDAAGLAPADVRPLRDRYARRGYTDLLLMP
ncbi:MAG: FkbM family methyltransferase [Acidimicrobiia bacterium]